ncbi:hypothetical protein N7466_010073 [Penicillium verhagenii]|uniref:uncharacterized protein n=1 Tax=Penicillium verhagenii TaxID=1562060 RepID=UPI00254566CA|nr:uncharacterized protein N7466_010073 [Penicillium verhagenii]KAJ5919130.1 hypothetical protein N7466_010073 [Penicillium verhagenii]
MEPQTNSSSSSSLLSENAVFEKCFKDIWPFPVDSDQDSINQFLQTELKCPTIDALFPYMYWVAKRSGMHIDALHNNLVKNRKVVVTEDPELHLIWHKNTIWIKPLPLWLLDKEFWDTYLPITTATSQEASETHARLDATGFIRSYTRLIRHESDFLLAQEKHIISKERISFADFQLLTLPFRDKGDDEVSKRYHYGQIRLSRLNWAVRFFQPSSRRYHATLGRLYYQQLYWDTSAFLQTSVAPFVFIFGTLSVILSSMQVALAVETDTQNKWGEFSWASWVFSIAVLVFVAVLLAVLALIVVILLLGQASWGWRHGNPSTSRTMA